MNATDCHCKFPCDPPQVLAGYQRLDTNERIRRTIELAACLVEDTAYEIARHGTTSAVTKLILMSRDPERFPTVYGYDLAQGTVD